MINQLKDLGLSDNEAKVYMAMLELGPATVLDISGKAGVNRPTTYVQIESLKKMGLVSTQNKGKKQLFIAESPEQLEYILDKQKSEIENKKEELRKILPELTGIFNLSDQKPQVRFFEGKEGLLKMHSELLKTDTDEVVSFSSTDSIGKIFPDYPKTLSQKRVKKGIRSRLIYVCREPVMKEKDEAMLRETKYLSPEKFPFKSDIAVYGNNIGISALEGNIVGVIITHKELADSFRALFNLTWQSLK
jgi:sugar-specific transcriptional regulator TrmB